MTDSAEVAGSFVGITGATSAGRLLRDARQAQGLHIAALATSIKVAPRKLELLETDRVDELPDPAFTRALAQTVCRALKIDPAPVLRLLPAVSDRRLESVGEGLNTPFRDRPGQFVPNDMSGLRSPAVWVPLLLLLGALVVWLMPAGVFERAASGLTAGRDRASAPTTATATAAPTAITTPTTGTATSPLADASSGFGPAPAVAEVAPASSPAVSAASSTHGAPLPAPLVNRLSMDANAGEALATTSLPIGGGASLGNAEPALTGLLQLRTRAQSWVEVTDARGQSLVARLLQPGEAIGVDGMLPLKVRIGNASGTDLSFRGQPLALAAYTRDNVARLDLK